MSTTDVGTPLPPAYLILTAAAAVLVSTILLAVDIAAASVAGYVLATFVALTSVTAFRWSDNRRRQDVSYVSSPKLARAGTFIAALAVVAAAVHVWNLATRLAS